MLAILVLLTGATLAGGLVGWGCREWRYAEEAARLHASVRDGTRRVYATTKDGRSADNLPAGRYAEGNQ